MATNVVELGDKVRDVVTGFEGVVASWQKHMHGCDRLVVDPTKLGDDDKPLDGWVLDIMRLTLVEKGILAAIPYPTEWDKLTLGAVVKDRVTGFQGLISVIEITVSGVVMMGVDPAKVDKDGQPAKSAFFHAGRLELVEEKPVPVAPEAPKVKPGGPSERRSASKRSF